MKFKSREIYKRKGWSFGSVRSSRNHNGNACLFVPFATCLEWQNPSWLGTDPCNPQSWEKWFFSIFCYEFLAPTGAQEMQISIHLSVCLVKVCLGYTILIFFILQDDFRMTSGWLQDDSESIKQAFRALREYWKSTERAIRLCHTVGA